jgi:hypothetical protein
MEKSLVVLFNDMLLVASQKAAHKTAHAKRVMALDGVRKCDKHIHSNHRHTKSMTQLTAAKNDTNNDDKNDESYDKNVESYVLTLLDYLDRWSWQT